MVQIAPWKKIAILLVCLAGLFFALPNVLPASVRDSLPEWMPQKTVNLGLDLRGGAHLLYAVDVESVFDERTEMMRQDLRSALRKEQLSARSFSLDESGISFSVRDEADLPAVRKLIRRNYPEIVIEEDGDRLKLVFDQASEKRIFDQTISQSIEIVRRRIDELGTTEPVIQRQGEDRILVQAPGADAQSLKAVIGTTAKLTFHLLSESGAGGMTLPDADTGAMIRIEKESLITGDMLDDAYPTDQQGQVAIGFRLNSVGSRRFCEVTRTHIGKPFAIVLDEEILSAPVIQSAICGGQGVITGNFNYGSANDLATLLRAGALPAPMHVVEERSVGPSLGADSIEAGKMASIVGLVGVLVFMAVTYSLFGIFANIALVFNMALLFALLSLLQATLTLPGIAGIVLTVGMAVDANVLVFERIREELAQGRNALASIDAGYKHAMSTIIDSNLTTLIAAFILFSFGTGPVKGFAVTLGLGIMTSMFSAIMVTRLLIVMWLDEKKGRKSKELPI
jgi:preprotein translocase subunit SecD